MKGPRPAHFAVVLATVALLGGGCLYQRWRYLHTPHASGAAVHPRVGFPLPFRMTEVAGKAGVDHVDELFEPAPSLRNIAPLLGAVAGASVSVADVDGDGWMDAYATSSKIGSKNRLFLNNRDGTFREAGAAKGLADVNKTAGSLKALFFDYDNDGRKDMFLVTTYCPRLYHQRADGTFEDVTAGSGVDRCAFTTASNAVDFDRDGWLDLIVAQHFKDVDFSDPKRFDFMWENGSYSANGGTIDFYRNEKGKGFKRVPGAFGIPSRGWAFSIGAYDLRGTGRQDLYFAMTHGSDQLFLNDGGGKFRDVSKRISKGDSHSAMSTEAADVDNDGRPFVMVTDDFEPGRDPSVNFLWKALDKEGFANQSMVKGVDRCGFAWGSKFVDLDNDGWLDLVVANGFLSENPEFDYRYIMDSLVGGGTRKITADPRVWPPMNDASIEGFQEACVFYHKDGRFADVSYDTPFLGDLDDERGVAAIDWRNDGAQGFFMAVRGGRLKLYRVDPPAGNGWIGFSLTGTKSARDAFGTKVVLRMKDGRTLRRELEPANGFLSQSDGRVHFGLGPSSDIDSVEVRWPLGRVETYRGLKPGKYHSLREGDGREG